MNSTELKKALAQFYGSAVWYQFRPTVLLTEGAKFLADTARAWWLMDIIASYQQTIRARYPERWAFQSWKLIKADGDAAVVTCEDGNGMALARQWIPFTDFPLAEVTLWAAQNERGGVTIMLPNEY